jgi:hypothetical protein
MIFSLLLFLLICISMVLQEFIPTIEMVHHGRLLLVPVVFLSSSITVPYPVMLALALAAGLMWDARNVVMVEGAAPGLDSYTDGEIVTAMEVDLPFGYTIFLYGLLGSLMQGVRPLFRRGRWELPSVMIGFATLLLLLFEYLFINFRRGDFYFPAEIWHKIVSSALLSMLVAPLVFLLLYRLAAGSGYRIRYEGLARRREYGR